MNYLLFYLLIGIGGAMLAAAILPKRLCVVASLILLFLGIVAPAGLWSYGMHFVTGDDSAYGMGGTILAILFAPSALTLSILTLLKE